MRPSHRLLLSLALTVSFAASARAVTWNVLVAVYPNTRVDCIAAGTTATHIVFSDTLTTAKIATMRTATENFANLVASWSNGGRSVAVDFVVIDDPITCVALAVVSGPTSYWVEPGDLFFSRLPDLVATGKYDSVFVLWDSGEAGEIPTPAYAGLSWGSPVYIGGRKVTYSTVPWATFNNPDNSVYLYSPEVMVHEWLHPMPAYYRDNAKYRSPDADEATTYGYPTDANGSFATFYRDVLRGRVVDTRTTPQTYTGISDSVWAFGATQHPASALPPQAVQLLAPLDYDCASTTPTLHWQAVPGTGISYVVSLFDAANPAAPPITIPVPTGTSLVVPGAAGLQPFGVYGWSVQAFSGASGSAPADLLHFIAGGSTAAPVISPGGGPLPATGSRVHVAPAGAAAPIRYTLDGSDPGSSSMLLGIDGELDVTPPATLKARAFGVSSCGASPIATASFTLPAPIVVDKTDDTGTGSLRAAMTAAEANPGPDTITFEIPGGGVQTIAPQSPLPVQTQPVTIDGWPDVPGYSGPPLIVLNGAGAGVSNGLTLQGGDSLVRGLVINGWNGNGIELSGAGRDRIVGCRIGTSADGSTAVPNTHDGIYVQSVSDNIVGDSSAGGGNLLSGNGIRGVEIYNAPATRNVIEANLIGTNASGTAAIPNSFGGVAIFAAPGNFVGGGTDATRNVISGNGTGAAGNGDGVTIADAGATGNVVIGNYIGTTIVGTAPLANSRNGVIISVSDSGSVSASGNEIGGASFGEGNVISGNAANGIAIVGQGGGGTGNVVQGNWIGTDYAGLSAIGNGVSGVTITRGLPLEQTPSGNLIGGTTVEAGNVISGNHVDGVTIVGQSATGNTVEGNYIGVDQTGLFALGNTRSGVRLTTSAPGLSDTASNNEIGGTAGGARNVISANGANGVAVIGNQLGGSGNRIEGNWIGLTADASGTLPNGVDGVLISTLALGGSATANVVGGAGPGAGNVIGGHPGAGVKLEGAGATSNTVAGNFIGVTQAGATFGNAGPGVSLTSPNNTVTANTVQANAGAGVLVSSVTGDRVSANSIFANGGLGIDLQSANDGQPAPLIATAVASTATLVSGSLTAASSTLYQVELFSSPSCDASGAGEGAAFLGTVSLQTAANGVAPLQTVLPSPLALGSVVTATATDPNGNTSGFSACTTVTSGPLDDADGDGVLDPSDDCTMVPDPAQTDSGGVGGSTPDGIGDACQCGDVTLDGAVTASDVTLYRAHLASPTGLPFLGAAGEKCSVVGVVSSQCDLLDVVVLRRTLAGQPPYVAQVCRASSGS